MVTSTDERVELHQTMVSWADAGDGDESAGSREQQIEKYL